MGILYCLITEMWFLSPISLTSDKTCWIELWYLLHCQHQPFSQPRAKRWEVKEAQWLRNIFCEIFMTVVLSNKFYSKFCYGKCLHVIYTKHITMMYDIRINNIVISGFFKQILYCQSYKHDVMLFIKCKILAFFVIRFKSCMLFILA